MVAPVCTWMSAVCGPRARRPQPDIVKDDSSSYAVFTEQGSSASQMTAAKEMDVIARLCKTSSRRSTSLHSRKNGRRSEIAQDPEVRVTRFLDTSSTTQMAEIMVQVWKTQSFLSKGICTVTFRQDYCGKSNLTKFFWNTAGRNPNWECLFVHREK